MNPKVAGNLPLFVLLHRCDTPAEGQQRDRVMKSRTVKSKKEQFVQHTSC